MKRFVNLGVSLESELPSDPPLLMPKVDYFDHVKGAEEMLKEMGATIWVGEQSAWHSSAEVAYDATGIRKATSEAGADEVLNWENSPRVEVRIPGRRSLRKASVHKLT